MESKENRPSKWWIRSKYAQRNLSTGKIIGLFPEKELTPHAHTAHVEDTNFFEVDPPPLDFHSMGFSIVVYVLCFSCLHVLVLMDFISS